MSRPVRWLTIFAVWNLVALFFVSAELMYPRDPGVTTATIALREFVTAASYPEEFACTEKTASIFDDHYVPFAP